MFRWLRLFLAGTGSGSTITIITAKYLVFDLHDQPQSQQMTITEPMKRPQAIRSFIHSLARSLETIPTIDKTCFD